MAQDSVGQIPSQTDAQVSKWEQTAINMSSIGKSSQKDQFTINAPGFKMKYIHIYSSIGVLLIYIWPYVAAKQAFNPTVIHLHHSSNEKKASAARSTHA